ncbi:hypothetical protein [Bacteroides caecimuris]|jgi:hypothetical protein|uniref:hypothetical protein n=1 Tax=Bacteroides caecimuris TaxID=1796613 RepID=UPI00256FECCD|nr:hypothetical protein [Bacteroides caecimuris]
MLTKKDKVDQFIRDLRSCDYYCRMIIDLNLKLEEIAYKLQGVSSPSIKDVCCENAGDPYSDTIKLSLMNKESSILQERQKYINRIMECEKIEAIIVETDKKMIIDLYVIKMKYDEVSIKYSRSRSTMFDDVHKIIETIV